MKKHALLLFACLLFAACGSGISPEKLYGKWKYIKVDNPNANPPTHVPEEDIKTQQPYVEFLKDNTMQIVWSGKVLSHGSFVVDGTNIQFTEEWAKGQTRKFPFFVSKFDGENITFETLGTDGTRVVAVKEK